MGFLSKIFKKDENKKVKTKSSDQQKIQRRQFNSEGLVEPENEAPSPFLVETPRTINKR